MDNCISKTIVREVEIKVTEEIFNECILASNLDTGSDVTEDKFLISGKSPFIMHFIEIIVKQEVLKYIRTYFHPDATVGKSRACIFRTRAEHPIGYHQHYDSDITAVYYILYSGGDIVLHNPLSSKRRGYVLDVQEGRHFRETIIKPNNDKLLIFPSYVPHEVRGKNEGLRIALVMDFWIDVV